MAEKEYIERNELINNRPEMRNTSQTGKEKYNTGWNDCVSTFLRRIKEQPDVDVVEVVRCKDCKHYHNTQCFHPSYGDDCAINTERAENDYCSYGKRKDG